MTYQTENDPLCVLDTLYEGLFDDDAWQRGLTQTADLVSGSGLMLFSLNPSSGQIFRSNVVRLDSAVTHAYNTTWIHNDPRHAAGLTCPVGEPQVDGMLIGVKEFHRSAVFNELLKPADCPYHLAAWIERRAERGVVLTIQGTVKRGAFDEESRRRIGLLIPHFRRIVAAKDRLEQSQLHANGLLEMMDRLPFGVLLLGPTLEIIEASAVAQTVLASQRGLHASDGKLCFLRGADGRAFASRLQEDPARARLNDTVHVEHPRSGRPLSLQILPLTPKQDLWLQPTPRWLILIFDPQDKYPLTEDHLRQTLGITAAEAALARRLASGMSLTQAAQALSVSLNTVRTQLKSIYAKTGVNSQSQLVHRILAGPALLR